MDKTTSDLFSVIFQILNFKWLNVFLQALYLIPLAKLAKVTPKARCLVRIGLLPAHSWGSHVQGMQHTWLCKVRRPMLQASRAKRHRLIPWLPTGCAGIGPRALWLRSRWLS